MGAVAGPRERQARRGASTTIDLGAPRGGGA